MLAAPTSLMEGVESCSEGDANWLCLSFSCLLGRVVRSWAFSYDEYGILHTSTSRHADRIGSDVSLHRVCRLLKVLAHSSADPDMPASRCKISREWVNHMEDSFVQYSNIIERWWVVPANIAWGLYI